MAALKTAPATTVSLARFGLETQKKRCDKMIKDGWKAIWGVRRSLEWWSDLKCEKKKAKYGMYLCAMLINQQNGVLMGINGKPICRAAFGCSCGVHYQIMGIVEHGSRSPAIVA